MLSQAFLGRYVDSEGQIGVACVLSYLSFLCFFVFQEKLSLTDVQIGSQLLIGGLNEHSKDRGL